jgi:transposase-like protein
MRKRYSATFKAQVVLEVLREEKTVAQIAAVHGVHPTQLHKWKTQALAGLPSLFGSEQQTAAVAKAAHKKQLQDLYAEIGRLTTQVRWLGEKSGLDSDQT